MRWTRSPALAFIALLSPAAAHWNYASLIVNDEVTEEYEYVRRTKNSNGPIEDVTSPDIICNNGGIDDDVMAETKTFTVAPGDEVGFVIRDVFGHPGPQQVYLSKAPGLAKNYKGDGDWFKVYSLSTSNLTADPITWAAFDDNGGINNFTFTLPNDLPPGQYLMRAEGLGLHSAGTHGGAQFYLGCAQLEVTGNGAGTPGPMVKFPGAYDGYEPGLLVSLYWPPLRNYTVPGPAVWPNDCEDHTANTLGSPSDGDCTPLEEGAEGDAPQETETSASASTSAAASTSTTLSTSAVTSTPPVQSTPIFTPTPAPSGTPSPSPTPKRPRTVCSVIYD